MVAGLAHLRLVIDIWSMRLFLWLVGTNGELLDSHLFYYVRYSQLAELHERGGRFTHAARLDAIAEHYFQLAPGGDDDPPEAAAMAQPVPPPMIFTDAVSRTRVPAPKRDDGPSSIAPAPAGC
jgi:hypothetical protein